MTVARCRVFERPTLGLVLCLVAAWVLVVAALHVGLDSRGRPARTAEARTLQVGGLPVT